VLNYIIKKNLIKKNKDDTLSCTKCIVDLYLNKAAIIDTYGACIPSTSCPKGIFYLILLSQKFIINLFKWLDTWMILLVKVVYVLIHAIIIKVNILNYFSK